MAFADTTLPKNKEVEKAYDWINTKIKDGKTLEQVAPSLVEVATKFATNQVEPDLVAALLVTAVVPPGQPESFFKDSLTDRGLELAKEIQEVRGGEKNLVDATENTKVVELFMATSALETFFTKEVSGKNLDAERAVTVRLEEVMPGFKMPMEVEVSLREKVQETVDVVKTFFGPIVGTTSATTIENNFSKALNALGDTLKPVSPAPAAPAASGPTV